MKSIINREFIKNEDGQAVLETALVIPIILMLVTVGITVSLLLYSQIIVTMSASNGARVGAAIWKETTLTEIEKKEAIKNASLSMVKKALSGEERRYKISENEGMLLVTVEYDFKVILPFSDLLFDSNIITIGHTAEYYIGTN